MPNRQTIHLGTAKPHITAEAQEDQALPPEFANHPFVFAHFTNGWEYDLEAGFVPSLCEIKGKPGCNGVGDDGKLTRALAGAMEKGGTVIHPNDGRLGEWMNYVGVFPVRGGGKHYTFIRAAYTVLPGGHVVAEDRSAELRAFKVHLRDSGIVPAMERAVFEMLMEIESKGLARIVKAHGKGQALPEAVDAKKARIAAMQKAWKAECDRQGKTAAQVTATVAPDPTDGMPVPGKRVKLQAQPAPAEVPGA